MAGRREMGGLQFMIEFNTAVTRVSTQKYVYCIRIRAGVRIGYPGTFGRRCDGDSIQFRKDLCHGIRTDMDS